MGIVNTKSTMVGNADSSPVILTDPAIGFSPRRDGTATVEVAAADDNTSTFRMFRVWSGWRVCELLLWNDAIASGTAFDVGLYQTAENGGAVVDADCWASDVSMASARATSGPLNLTFEALNIDKIEKKVWEVAAVAVTTLTADPRRWYDICLTADTIGTAAGTISMSCGVVAP